MSKNNEICWTCKKLNAGKCPIKQSIKKFNKFNNIDTVVSSCKEYSKIEV